ncbi:MAG TPA: tetratricopeptide repeat protein [Candidatus Dormibacteraeota bacterium]|nr:tetratricopeptide repeat protein [Candidatus Dormibacteraeota bacterium]
MKASQFKMKTKLIAVLFALVVGAPVVLAGTSQAQEKNADAEIQPLATETASANTQQSDLYYDIMMGHLKELQFEENGNADAADESIDFYKKALQIAPHAAVILERLAEIDANSQHTADAITEAQAALQADPSNVDAHRLLARVYVRSLSDQGVGASQQEYLTKAVQQFEAVLQLDPKDTYSALWLARLYGFENQPEQAEKVLRGVLQRDSQNEPALEQLSQLLMDEGRAPEAITLLKNAVSDTSSSDLYGVLGDAYAHQHDFAKAENAYRKAVANDPTDASHRHGLAQALMSEGKYAEALAQFKKLTELEPNSADNYLRMSELQRRLGQMDDAQSSLDHAKKLAPGSLEVIYNQALLYEDDNHFDRAAKMFSDAIASLNAQGNARNAGALAILYEQLGHAYRGEHNYSAAIDAFEDMSKLSPDAAKRAQLLLIDTYRADQQIDRAIDLAQKARAESPKDQDLTITLAMLYGEKSDTATATQLLRGLLNGNESDQGIYLDIAEVQENGKKFGEAEQSAQKAEQLAKESPDKQAAWFMLGAIYDRQKKYSQAETQFRKVLDVNPDNAPVLNYYGYMLADRGVRMEEATSLIQRALKVDPNNGAYLDSLGWAYFKQNRLTEAEQYLRQAIDRQGNDPTILEHLGDVYLKLGNTQQAAQTFEQALAQWQKAAPADYQPAKVNELDSQLKKLKKRLAQKSSPETAKPQ